ncbi:hypothetical protein AWB71_00541 [Caballeronia peredens]|nr:hypothetical protein AWB71_00541 [Caballeronia peredens]
MTIFFIRGFYHSAGAKIVPKSGAPGSVRHASRPRAPVDHGERL